MIQMEQYFGSPFDKWARSYCYKNHWRVQHVIGHDIEDAYAQCALYWVQCYEFYRETVHDDPLMMHMFKLWVTGQFNDLSNKETNYKKIIQDNEVVEGVDLQPKSLPEKPVFHEAELHLKLEKASDELKQVLKIFLDAPKDVMDLLRTECQSACPKSFFKKIVTYLKIDQAKAPQLAKELQDLLS